MKGGRPLPQAIGVVLLAAGIALVWMTGFTGRLQSLTALANVALGTSLLALGRFQRGTWRRRVVGAAMVIAPIVLLPALIFVLVEVGETAVLRTTGKHGTVFETRLWVVDYGGAVWIAAGTGAERRWFRRLMANPRVELVRGEVARCALAVPVEHPGAREFILRRLVEQYPWGVLASLVGNRLFFPTGASSQPVVIRLDPCPGAGP